ncbi:class C sortase, partial [Streptococcus pneumoniae]|nr:class C sortase [Streptococcus pneumoniae]
IDVDLPVYAGTAEEVLQQGAGHLEGTSLPIGGNSTHAVITAHTGLPTAKMFTDLTKLKVGDKFYVHNIKEVMAYQVDQVKVIEPTNFDDLLIVPGHDYVTL